jgi:hypothetical protein
MNTFELALLIPLKICPKPVPGAAPIMGDVAGHVAWTDLQIFGIAGLVCIGSIAIGKIFRIHNAPTFGAVGLCTVVLCAILYMLWTGFLDGIVGNGCI